MVLYEEIWKKILMLQKTEILEIFRFILKKLWEKKTFWNSYYLILESLKYHFKKRKQENFYYFGRNV